MKGKILPQLIGSFSIIYKILYIPGGAGFLPSTVLGSGALVVTLRFDMWGSNLHSYRRRQSWHQTLYICSLCTKIVKDYLSEKGEWLRSEGLECVQKLVSVHAFGGLHRNHLQPRNTRIAWIVATWPMETGVPQPGRYDRRLETTMAVAKAPWRETRRNSSFHIEWKTKHGFSSKYCRILEALQMDFQDVWRGRRLRT